MGDKIVHLTCACCGACTHGRQWHNQDTGFGLCPECADRYEGKTPGEEFARNYGLRGTHYATQEPRPPYWFETAEARAEWEAAS